MQTKKLKFISWLTAVTMMFLVGGIPTIQLLKKSAADNGNGVGGLAAVESATESYQPTIVSSIENGATVALLEGGIYDCASNYVIGGSQNYYTRGNCFQPKPLSLRWTCEDGALYYTVKMSTSADMSNAQSYLCFTPYLEIEDLFAGTHYYYQIIAKYENRTVKSRIFDVYTANLPRTIHIEGVSNTRDIGGYYTTDGKYRVRQGMVYRGGALDKAIHNGAVVSEMTQAGKEKLLHVYNIKTDLDVRGSISASPLGSAVNFVNVSGPYYVGGAGIDSNADSSHYPTWSGTYKDALLKEIQTFANPDNYPIYFHCQIGRDRTGTLAFLINALLGVSEQDLYMEYELSFFSEAGCRDGQQPMNMMSTFRRLVNHIKNYSKGNLKKDTESFMLDLGVTIEEIDSIRTIMLEEVNA
jgi:hypothetical protein